MKDYVETDYGQRVSLKLIRGYHFAPYKDSWYVYADTVKSREFVVAEFETMKEAADHIDKLVAELQEYAKTLPGSIILGVLS